MSTLYNVGVKVQRPTGQITAMVLLSDWVGNRAFAESVMVDRIEAMAVSTKASMQGMRGYGPTDSSVRLVIGPEILSAALVEFTILEIQQ